MPPRKRNPYITAAQERCLRYLAQPFAEDIDTGEQFDGYMIQGGRDVWYGLTKTHPKLVMSLLRLCLIKETEANYEPGGTHIYMINEDGRGVLESVDYVPRIMRPYFGEPNPYETIRETLGPQASRGSK